MDPKWLVWAKQLQAIAQNGLTYSQNAFDTERYDAVRRVCAEMLATATGLPSGQFMELYAREEGYATPKVDVRGVVFRPEDGSILLVKERMDGRWTIPGGWADPGQSPQENVAREVLEESGFKTRVVKLLAVYDRSKHPHSPLFPFHVYKMFFLCEIIGGEATENEEISEVGFFRSDSLPDLSVGRVTSAQIARMFEHRLHPDWPTEFD
ncbi:MAG: NUDIX domain-containing protein [Acidobacteria bacterium]|nr:MAG: NUDIX domain-containing protein [Acidobacteriota bacterium]